MSISYQGGIEPLSITNFTGYSRPLSAMMASVQSDAANVQFYQSSCSDSNSLFNFSMGFSNEEANELLSDCQNYNSPTKNVFVPAQPLTSFANVQSSGLYTVNVGSDNSLEAWYVSQIGIQVCVYVNYLILKTTSQYVNPGNELQYGVYLGVYQTFGSLVNVTLSCYTVSINDTVMAYYG